MPRPIANTAWTAEERLRLRRRRIDLGYSQTEIAARLEIAPRYLSNIELGPGRPGHRLHARLRNLLSTLKPKADRRPAWSDREAFRARRLRLGFSAVRVAEMLGVCADLLSRWERGVLNPTVVQQRALQRVSRLLERASPDLRQPHGKGLPKADKTWHSTLRARRQEVGLTLSTLGLRAGMHASTIGLYETQKGLAAVFQAAKIDAAIERERIRLEAQKMGPVPLSLRGRLHIVSNSA